MRIIESLPSISFDEDQDEKFKNRLRVWASGSWMTKSKVLSMVTQHYVRSPGGGREAWLW
jgi:hypothetical protein